MRKAKPGECLLDAKGTSRIMHPKYKGFACVPFIPFVFLATILVLGPHSMRFQGGPNQEQSPWIATYGPVHLRLSTRGGLDPSLPAG